MSASEEARVRALLAEKEAVIARIKAYFAPWRTDKRMRIMGDIVDREIARIEAEEAAITARGRP